MTTVTELWTRLQAQMSPGNRAVLQNALLLAQRVHAGQFRRVRTGNEPVPYLTHPLRVALICLEEWERSDVGTLVTCLLHDVLEDSPPDQRAELEASIQRFAGVEVAQAVVALSKPQPAPLEAKDAQAARYFSVLRASPEWVRLVKCADRVDNLRDAIALGDLRFWESYSSETIGWHLFLARETAPIAEVALFKALVDGERILRGHVPVWADGRIIDPVAAHLIPEHVARAHQVIGLAVQGNLLYVGVTNIRDPLALEAARQVTGKDVRRVQISPDAMQDALRAGLYGKAPL